MNQVHLTLQGKGGVGKSYVASLMAQYLTGKGRPVACIDTDPVNHSFSQYKAFGTRELHLLDGSKVNERHFDELLEMVLEEDVDFVIDNGASSFIPLSSYLIENDAIETLAAAGRQVVIHSVITGGQATLETLSGLDRVANDFSSEADIIVWLNEFFGDIRDEEKEFEEMKAYQRNKDRISGTIRIGRRSADTFGKDIETMLNLKLTFDEAMKSSNFRLMAQRRLGMVKEDLFSQLDLVFARLDSALDDRGAGDDLEEGLA